MLISEQAEGATVPDGAYRRRVKADHTCENPRGVWTLWINRCQE